jgi:3-phosphoshikimate 1-carboxyvinyltransferase
MSRVLLRPAVLRGEVTPPPSKSEAHRAILCAALAGGVSRIRPVVRSKDIDATVAAVRALGAAASLDGEVLTVDGSGMFRNRQAEIDCAESGSTLRFLIPVAAAGGVEARFVGRGRLPQRPIGPYLDCLPQNGAALQTEGGLPLATQGRLRPGEYRLPGNVSSQFVTGLLLALPLLPGDSEIRLTSPLESAGYVEMTLHAMGTFGVHAEKTESGYHVPGNQRYRPCDYTVEGDWSQAAFFLAAGALGGSLRIRGLRRASTQGDRAAAELFARFGAAVSLQDDEVVVSPCTLRGIEVDAAGIPDLVPALAVTAAFAKGVTRITNAARLRIKESDRLAAVAQGILRLGGRVQELPDGLVIEGVPALMGGKVAGCNDHRIVMAFAVAALRAKAAVEIDDAQSIQKSYPSFFEDYNRLGGHADVVGLG